MCSALTAVTLASALGFPAFATTQTTFAQTFERKAHSLGEASLASKELSISRDPGLNPWTGVALNVLGPAAVLATGGTLATLGSNPMASQGQAYVMAGNTLIYMFPIGASAGYLYGQDPQRGLGVGLGGAGVAAASTLLGTALAQHPAGGLLLSLVAGTAYIGWSLFDVYHTIDSKASAQLQTNSSP